MHNGFEPKKCVESFSTVDIPATGLAGPYIDFKFEDEHLKMVLLGLYDYITKSGFKQIVLGSSGGVDSAIVATLATLAIGKENVNCSIPLGCWINT
jgi:hypothetical protein